MTRALSGLARRRMLLAAGVLGSLIAGMSFVDMFAKKPYDGVVPDPYSTGGIVVRDVVPGGPAERAGIRRDDVILGIGARMLRVPTDAPPELRRHRIGEEVGYLVSRDGRTREVKVRISSYRAGSISYVSYAVLGALFFALGIFVLSRRPDDAAVQVFYVLCVLFMLFFACRLRPSSYYWIDWFVQVAGTLALFLLPAVFLHFFLLFPRQKVFRFADAAREAGHAPRWMELLQEFLNGSPLLFTLLYTLPPAFYTVQMALGTRGRMRLVYGAPRDNWVLLADYLILGLLALAHSWWTTKEPRMRRAILALLLGTVCGTVPFVVFAIYFPSYFRNEGYLAWGVVPMALIPFTFAYAIVRFRLFDVQVIVRKSIVYAVLTAFVTGVYALGVVAGNAFVSSTSRFSSPVFATAFGLVVVLLFDPLRRRMQGFVDRVFFRDRLDFQAALLSMSRSVTSQIERPKIEELLTLRAAELLRLEPLTLLVPREDGAFARPGSLGDEPALRPEGTLARLLLQRGAPVRVAELDPFVLDEGSRRFLAENRQRGTTALVPVATRGRLLSVLAVSGTLSEEAVSREDLDHLATVASQGAVALEAAALHEELTRRAEMERDLEIARDIQRSLFPSVLPQLPGIELWGFSLPARVVGGDFYDTLEMEGAPHRMALVLGDVSGKSIPASLLMVAAKEIVYARAMGDPDPATVFRESNRRVYDIKRKMFVSLAYVLLDSRSLSLTYAIGGQPLPLLVKAGCREAVEIPAPQHRLPLGALREVPYDARTLYLSPGDLLLLYTDGLSEAMSTEMNPYGEERLKASLVRHAARPLPEVAEELMEDIRQFTYGAEQYDDQTFVLLRVLELVS